MEELLGKFYCVFESFFGKYLGDHLWGFDCTSGAYDKSLLFNQIGLITIGITLISVIAFYYWPLNHPRFNRWWSWLIVLFSNSGLNLLIGYLFVNSDFQNGTISDCLRYERNELDEIVGDLITVSDLWGFGFANFFVSAILFIILSFLLKWWSSNCKHAPFL